MPAAIENHFEIISKAAAWIADRGWGISFFGNISILSRTRIDPGKRKELYEVLGSPSNMIGSLIAITRTGSTMADVRDRPEDNIGLYSICGPRSLALIDGTGPPSSEITSHLWIHSKLEVPSSYIVHCHIGPMLDDIAVIEDLPDWLRTVPVLPPGSIDLARASREHAALDTVLIWAGHGLVSISSSMEDAISMIERATLLRP